MTQPRTLAVAWRVRALLAASMLFCGAWTLSAQDPTEEDLVRAGRQYRRQVYVQFHANRPEFDRRRALAAQADAAYREAGATPIAAKKLQAWLLAGAAASQRSAAVPPLPDFVDARVVEHAASQSTSTATTDALPHMEPPAPLVVHTESIQIIDHASSAAAASTPRTTEPPEPLVKAVPEIEPAPATASISPAPALPEAESTRHPESPTAGTHDAVPPHGETEATVPVVVVEAPPSAPSGVNVTELAARIDGHNFAVRGLLLDWRKGADGDPDGLKQAVEKVAALAQRYEMLHVYHGLLTPAEQETVETPEELDDVFAALGDAIAAQRERMEEFSTSAGERERAIETLNGLSRTLADAYGDYQTSTDPQP